MDLHHHPCTTTTRRARYLEGNSRVGQGPSPAGHDSHGSGLSFGERMSGHLDRSFSLEAVRVTEAAAINAARQIGRGDEHAAAQAAVEAMRNAFNILPIDGTVVIGEGERDEAPMLYIGEKVGSGGIRVDIALDPL